MNSLSVSGEPRSVHDGRVEALARNVFVLVGLAAMAGGCARPPAAEHPARPNGPSVRVLTYNVNFGIAGDSATIAAIRDADADLVLLQETNAAWERALRASLSGELPQMIFKNRGGAGGLAVLSRLPILEVELIAPAGEGWFPAVRIVVETAFGRVQALSVHLHPPVSEGGSFVSGVFKVRRGGRSDHLPVIAVLIQGKGGRQTAIPAP